MRHLDVKNIEYRDLAKHVTLTRVDYKGVPGYLLHFTNRKGQHAISDTDIDAFNGALDVVLTNVQEIDFLTLYGDHASKNHVGANAHQFEGDVNLSWAKKHTHDGVEMDAKIKELSQSINTVGIYSGRKRWGGSNEWVAMAEFSIVDSRTSMLYSESNIGLIPGWSGWYNTLLKSGPLNAEYLTKTGNYP